MANETTRKWVVTSAAFAHGKPTCTIRPATADDKTGIVHSDLAAEISQQVVNTRDEAYALMHKWQKSVFDFCPVCWPRFCSCEATNQELGA